MEERLKPRVLSIPVCSFAVIAPSPSLHIISSFAKTAVNLFEDFCLFCLSTEFVAKKT